MTSSAVQIERLDSTPVAVIRRRAKASQLSRIVPECCGLVFATVRAQQVRAGRHVAIYWDDSIRVEVGVELYGPFIEQGEGVLSATPAGTVASAAYFGAYSGLEAVHDAIHQWCKARGHRLAGPNWEIYGHWQPEWNANTALIRTDVYYLPAG